MAWRDDLQPASFRGVAFGVDVADSRHGRNTGEHLYPFRDANPAWIEDAGIMASAHRITGYLIGDDVAAQQRDLVDAAQQPGAAELVHPTLGSLQGSIVGGLTTVVRNGQGGYIEVAFAFVENDGAPLYPAEASDTGAGVTSAATDAKTASAASYVGSGLRDKG